MFVDQYVILGFFTINIIINPFSIVSNNLNPYVFVTIIILYSFFCVVSIESLLEMIQGRISSFRGVKFSGPDLPDFSRSISKYGKKYQILYSSEAVSTEIMLCTVDLLCNNPLLIF